MRGKLPRPLTVTHDDLPILQAVARSHTEPHYRVQRARLILGVASGQRIQAIAERLDCDVATVWRTCRRFELRGLAGILARPRHRPGPATSLPTDTPPGQAVVGELPVPLAEPEHRAVAVASGPVEVSIPPGSLPVLTAE